MKRSKALNVIKKIMKKWESCKIETKAADEVLTALEKLDMLPPKRYFKYQLPRNRNWVMAYKREWEE